MRLNKHQPHDGKCKAALGRKMFRSRCAKSGERKVDMLMLNEKESSTSTAGSSVPSRVRTKREVTKREVVTSCKISHKICRVSIYYEQSQVLHRWFYIIIVPLH